MRERKRGSIVNMGSISWMLALGGMPAYLTAKSAVHGLTRALARDVGPDGVRVNTVVPGWIMTERQVEKWLTPEGEAELMKGQCLKEKLHPPDVARMVLWLAADDSRMVTAQSFVVDGGWT
jgi:NAD(P)-dependent dehydrogenase (short-subunit alcohol dehydrogenase family)